MLDADEPTPEGTLLVPRGGRKGKYITLGFDEAWLGVQARKEGWNEGVRDNNGVPQGFFLSSTLLFLDDVSKLSVPSILTPITLVGISQLPLIESQVNRN